MPLRLVVYFPLLIIFSACHNASTTEEVRLLTQNLEYSNLHLAEKSNMELDYLKDRLKDWRWNDRAKIWIPKGDSCSRLCKQMLAELEVYKQRLIAWPQGEGRSVNEVPEGVYEELYTKLVACVNTSCNVFDPGKFVDTPSMKWGPMKDMKRLRKTILDRLGLQYDSSLQISGNARQWVRQTFDNRSASMTLAMLTKLENDIILTANDLIHVCVMYGTTGSNLAYPAFYAITNMNTSYVKQGQKLEVSLGAGSFSLNSKPTFWINGKIVEPNNEGVAVYSITSAGKPGKHTIPVIIEYYSPDGRLNTMKKELEYIIAK